MNRRRMVLAALVLALSGTTSVPTARAYDPITWRSMDGGGAAPMPGAGWRLRGTIGQPDAGTLTGGTFRLAGGFWTGGLLSLVDVGDRPVAARFHFSRPSPNPVRAWSRLSFDLPRPTRVALSVFDVTGRAVRRWDLGTLPAGRQERTWSTLDQGGRTLPPGVYFLRLDTESDRGIHKVLVLR